MMLTKKNSTKEQRRKQQLRIASEKLEKAKHKHTKKKKSHKSKGGRTGEHVAVRKLQRREAKDYMDSLIHPFECNSVPRPDATARPSTIASIRWFEPISAVEDTVADEMVAGVQFAPNPASCYRYVTAASGGTLTWSAWQPVPADTAVQANAMWLRTSSGGMRITNTAPVQVEGGVIYCRPFGASSDSDELKEILAAQSTVQFPGALLNERLDMSWLPFDGSGAAMIDTGGTAQPTATTWRSSNVTSCYDNFPTWFFIGPTGTFANAVFNVQFVINYEFVPFSTASALFDIKNNPAADADLETTWTESLYSWARTFGSVVETLARLDKMLLGPQWRGVGYADNARIGWGGPIIEELPDDYKMHLMAVAVGLTDASPLHRQIPPEIREELKTPEDWLEYFRVVIDEITNKRAREKELARRKEASEVERIRNRLGHSEGVLVGGNRPL